MKKSLLIVDDEFGLADLMAEILVEHGYEVRVAINGRLGLEAVAARRPDLILLDVMMPVMDGRTMLRALQSDPQLADIPVVMMTAQPGSLPRAGYAEALLKPFSLATLVATVQRLAGEPEADNDNSEPTPDPENNKQ